MVENHGQPVDCTQDLSNYSDALGETGSYVAIPSPHNRQKLEIPVTEWFITISSLLDKFSKI